MGSVNKRLVLLLVAATLLLVQQRASTEDGAAASKMDAKTDAVIRKLSEYLGSASRFAVDASVDVKLASADAPDNFHAEYTLTVQRPNRLALSCDSPKYRFNLASNGSEEIVYFPEDDAYARTDAPSRLGDAFRVIGLRVMDVGMVFIQTLLQENFYDAINATIEQGTYAGVENIGGVELHRLRFIGDKMNWEMWVESGDAPHVRKILPDIVSPARPGDAEGEDTKISAVVEFTNWTTTPAIPDGRFDIALPPTAYDLQATLQDLVDRPAPAASLKLLDGETVELAAHKGQDVVVLDFWATWCVPCRQAMPQVERAVKAFRSKGVELYAVNVGESAEEVRRFLEQVKPDITVALDPKGKVARRFGVESFPSLVIIGKDGVVKTVHAAVPPSPGALEMQLKRELGALFLEEARSVR